VSMYVPLNCGLNCTISSTESFGKTEKFVVEIILKGAFVPIESTYNIPIPLL
jgi:hypothetical protein